MTIEIETMLVLSTGHISEPDSKALAALADHDSFINVLWDREYGFLMHVDLMSHRDHEDIPALPTVNQVLDFAHKHNAHWLLLDCDGPLVDDLPQYHW